jgi:glycosyltransferase involved in cell wall biosynthesis
MKVYFVVKEPSERTINHFVSSLGQALQKQGCEVVYGLERLWTDEVLDCDIVHFQWPEGIFGLFGHQVTDEELKRMNQRLVWLKEHGKKLFYTCHNLKPHTNKNENLLRLYELIYSNADYVHHLGNYSCELLQSQYPNARHVAIPHHIYDNVFSFSVSQQEARRRLHLPQNKKIILSFGKFRNDQERNFVLNVKKQIEALSLKAEANSKLYTLNSTLFLLPGFYRETLHTWNPKKFITRLFHTINYWLKGIRFCNDVIPDDLMQCYFCAADVVLIQRLDILNSGNLPMAFHAGKVVVGPDVGNIGEILRETGNYTFDPHDMKSAVSALQKALKETAKGKENRIYATEYWSSDLIAAKLLKCYQETITAN